MASKQPTFPPSDKIALYDKLIEAHPNVERKGKTVPYTSLNGHMFSCMEKDGSVGLRLPPEAREAFLKEYNVNLFFSHNTVMKEYVTVPDSLLTDIKKMHEYLDISVAYIQSLKPKLTKRKKK